MLHGKGCSAKRSVPPKGGATRTPSSAPRWPKLCLGETYADLLYSLYGCVSNPSLLPVASLGCGSISL
jgi:hypothetical protein